MTPASQRRRRALITTAAAVLGAAVLYSSGPAPLATDMPAPIIDGDPADWIAESERSVAVETPIVPGTEKRILWQDPAARTRTEYAVVYLHGFSATRQEIAPVGEMLAGALRANLFETRLRGHGLAECPLCGVSAEDWLADASEALAVGSAIGERIVLAGTSTGATLALAISGHPAFGTVAALVLVSPNFAPADGRAELLTWPGGLMLAEMLVGETREWTPASRDQALYWATSYPTAAAVEMMRLVKYVRGRLPLALDVPVITFYSPSDAVVDVGRMRAGLARISAPSVRTVEISDTGDPGRHVLAGNILAPQNNELLLRHILNFLRESGL